MSVFVVALNCVEVGAVTLVDNAKCTSIVA